MFARLRLLVYLLITVLIVGVLPLYTLFSLGVDAIVHTEGQRLARIADRLALRIDGDAHSRITSAEDQQRPDFQVIYEQLRKMLDEYPDFEVVHLYTLRPDFKDGGVAEESVFVVDSAQLGDTPFLDLKDIARTGQKYCYADGMQEAFSGTPSANRYFYQNGCGVWLTGYAPIRTSEGGIDGILCVDGSVVGASEKLITMYNWCLFSAVLAVAFAVALSLIAGWAGQQHDADRGDAGEGIG